MSWWSTIVISLLSGALGVVSAGLIAQVCARWYRVSSFEGGAGYFVVFTALLGGLAACAVGFAISRIPVAGPSFFKGLALAAGAVLVLALFALAICRLFADLEPTLDGKELELEVEVRCPADFQVPQLDEYGAVAGVYLPGGRRLPTGKLRLDDAQTADGRLVVPGDVPLTTSASRKFLNVRFSDEHQLLFHLPLRSRPTQADLRWSEWIESGWDAGRPEPPPNARFQIRYQVRTVEPPPPAADPAELRAAEFAALAVDAPLEAWLPFLFHSPNAERTQAVLQRVDERQLELAQLIRSQDGQMREYALAATKYPATPAPELVDAVLAEGRNIADGIRRFNDLSAEDPKFHETLLDLHTRFHVWNQAWWELSQRLGLDGRPPVREIHELASVRAGDAAMNEIETNARTILQAIDETAAEKQP